MVEKKDLILCLETATEVCSVSLSQSGICIAEKSINEPNSHGTQLTVLIEDILKENNFSFTHLSAVAFSDGPGSYTGLRIGLSVAKGICYGSNIPLIAISTLEHMASAFQNEFCFPMIDARRMEVYGALLHQGKFIVQPFPCIITEFDWSTLLHDKKVCFIGNGAGKSKEILSTFPNAGFNNPYQISAVTLCGIAHQRWINKDFVDVAYHVPFYLKDANITEAKKKSL